ncbi:MAG TPA: hypothetical protein VF399_05890 [bacterium]
MKPLTRHLLYWSPRVLTILFAIFIGLFALDVFSAGKGFWETVLGLLIHLIPTAFIIGVLVFSWRREWIGAVIFVALAVLYIVLARGRFPLSTYVIIAGPLILAGGLFMLNWLLRASPSDKSK